MVKIKCENCETLNDENSKFCEKCGNLLNPKEISKTTNNTNNIINCPFCGQQIQMNSKKCIYCGEKLSTPVGIKNSAPLKLAIVGGFLVIISVIFYILSLSQFFNPISLLFVIIAPILAFFGAKLVVDGKDGAGIILTIVAGILGTIFAPILPMLGAIVGVFGGKYSEKNSKNGGIVLIVASILSFLSLIDYLIIISYYMMYRLSFFYAHSPSLFTMQLATLILFVGFIILLVAGILALKNNNKNRV
ncbi:MAG: zinc ribbon domain-containing protein [Methanobrevibacter sp.]|nr:zinc ribbon domain-containing protein [Methanobrevibacter sp.]